MFVVCTNIATLLQIVYDSRTANHQLSKELFEKDLPQDALPTTNFTRQIGQDDMWTVDLPGPCNQRQVLRSSCHLWNSEPRSCSKLAASGKGGVKS